MSGKNSCLMGINAHWLLNHWVYYSTTIEQEASTQPQTGFTKV